MRLRVARTACALIAVAACDASPTANTVTGAVEGIQLDTASAVAARSDDVPDTAKLSVTLANRAVACGDALAANAAALALDVQVRGAGAAISTGNYAVTTAHDADGANAFAAVYRTDAECTRWPGALAVSGRITVIAITSEAVSGTFDLAFPRGETMRGSFNAPVCAFATTDASAAPVCH